ncbi:hypothetical protein P171DRAFT_91288 [Karstenula rhodostoma CBS 690.94]|uniref:Uncharacterized protein n=1 Tax=Karstenula rhodostoma CBS 690.94 TaxID=1392251 RepID=A0A9P4PD46_9PLEO|nr:hypothetical protein P171DRAFT_91288 [Karstenula rhodostoma CBS 690.94]
MQTVQRPHRLTTTQLGPPSLSPNATRNLVLLQSNHHHYPILQHQGTCLLLFASPSAIHCSPPCLAIADRGANPPSPVKPLCTPFETHALYMSSIPETDFTPLATRMLCLPNILGRSELATNGTETLDIIKVLKPFLTPCRYAMDPQTSQGRTGVYVKVEYRYMHHA